MCETKGIITEEARFYATKTIKKIYWYVFFPIRFCEASYNGHYNLDATRCVPNIL